MADTKLSDLTVLAAGGVVATDELYINDGGVSKKVAASTVAQYTLERVIGADAVNVFDHGAVADGSTDNLAAFDAAEAACAVNGTIVIPTGSYRLSGTWVVPANKSLLFLPGAQIKAPQGSFGNEPVLHYNGAGLSAAPWCGIYGFPDFENVSTLSPITDTEYVAVLLQAIGSRRIEIGRVNGFYSGIRLYAEDGELVGFNSIECGNINGAVYNIDLVVDATGTSAWINSNWIRALGELTWTTTGGGDRAAVRIRRLNTPTDDNIAENIIDIATYEGVNSGVDVYIAQLHAGKRNVISVGHEELADGGIDIRADQGDTTENLVYIASPYDPAFVTVVPPASDPSNDWYGNQLLSLTRPSPGNAWQSPDIPYSAYEVNGTGDIAVNGLEFRHAFGSNTRTLTSSANAELIVPDALRDGAELYFDSGYIMGVYIDTRTHKTIYFSQEGSGSSPGRPQFVAYKSDGTQYDPNGTSTDAFRVNYGGFSITSQFGGSWTRGDDLTTDVIVVSVDDTVDKLFVAVGAAPNIRKFKVSTHPQSWIPQALIGWSDFSNQEQAKVITADPATFGYYHLGELLSLPGTPAIVPVTLAGYRAPAWVLSTAYTLGDLVENDTGKIYVCVTAGTSAGSGGPTGTGAGITDNTATWDYVGAEATFGTDIT